MISSCTFAGNKFYILWQVVQILKSFSKGIKRRVPPMEFPFKEMKPMESSSKISSVVSSGCLLSEFTLMEEERKMYS